jgi:hypothetical protein
VSHDDYEEVALASSRSEKVTIQEAARQTKVFCEADVVVVGGGPGGHSAAVAAGRNGAKTVLVERYGHLGGLTTGGLVTMLHSMSDGTRNVQIAGLCREWIDRLDARDACIHPSEEQIGATDKEVASRWTGPFDVIKGKLIYTVRFDPEILKCILNEMIEEAGVKLLLHSWGTQTIMEGEKVRGVIFESKSGRQAILAKAVIDGTGDGDLLVTSGVEVDLKTSPENRITKHALCFEFGNVDIGKMEEFRRTNPQKEAELKAELAKLNGFTSYFKTTRPGVAHFNMFLPGLNILDVEDLTWIEVNVRKRMLVTYDFLKKYAPGFDKSFVMITAPQLGVRGSRRMVGEHVLTEKDALSGTVFEDSVVEFPPIAGNYPEHPHVFVPYRCLVPRSVEGLLTAGRSFSSDEVVNEHYNPIAQCIVMGQAAGTAAALATHSGVRLRDVDIPLLQRKLMAQGMRLPGLSAAGSKAR